MAVPEKIGNYRLERALSRGEAGGVWLGRHIHLQDHVVAVKVVVSDDPAAVERFQREANTAARLRHPNITRLYDFGKDGPFLYTVAEYIAGGALRQLVTRRGRLPLEEAVAVFSQVAPALDYAHSLSIIHRDVSPANILCEERSARALLTDFGAARDVREPVTDPVLHGTPGYLSPEHNLSAARITHLSDIFSLGVVLYQMLSGELPWPASPTGKAIFAELIPLRERGVKEATAELDRVLQQLLAIEPAQRYASAGAAAEDLRRILERHHMKTQVLKPAAPVPDKVVEAQMNGIEPNEVETALGRDMVRPVLDRAHQRADELRNPAVIAGLLDAWAAQDGLRRKPLLGRLARLHKVSSRNAYFYTLRVLYEHRSLPEDDEEPDRGSDAFPLEPEVERWAVPLPAPASFVDDAGGRLRLPGSTRVVACKDCMGKGLTICPRCQGSRRVYVARPTALPGAAGAVKASAGAATATAPRRGVAVAPDALPQDEQLLVPCPDCEGRGGVTCERCDGVGRLIRRKAFRWSRTTYTMQANDDLPALNETWLAKTCKAEVIYHQRQQGGMRPEWSLVAPVAALIARAEARCDDENHIAQAELSVALIPVTDIVFDLGKSGEGGLYKLAIYGFEKLIPPDWRFFNWERVILLCLVGFLSVLVVVLLAFALIS